MKLPAAAIVLIASLLPVAANAGRRDGPFVVDPGIYAKTLSGPRTLIITGNPFRVPWQLAVNQQIVSGTGLTLPTQFTQPFTAPATSGSNAKDPASNGNSGGAAPVKGVIKVTPLYDPGAAYSAPGHCKSTSTYAQFKKCLDDLDTAITAVIGTGPKYADGTVGFAYASVNAAQREFLALQDLTETTLTDQTNNLSDEKTLPTAKRALQCLIGAISTATYSCPTGTATVQSVSAAISRIRPFPTQKIADEKANLEQLQGAKKSFTADAVAAELLKPKAERGVKDTQAKVDSLRQKLAAEKRSAERAKLAATLKDAEAARVAAETRKPSETDIKNAQALIDQAGAVLTGLDVKLQPYIAGGSAGKAYDDAVGQMQTIQQTVLSNVTISRFFVVYSENCTGVYGGGRTTVITVTRPDNVSNSVAITCPARAFVSNGFAFSSLPQHEFSAVPTNIALPSAPSGSATPPPARIAETTFSDVRPQPVVFLNVRFTAEESGDNGVYASFGLSVNSSPQNVTIDYLAGVSYALSRSIIGTVGLTLAPTTYLAPGYNLGAPIGADVKPQTVTRYRSALFLAITYGAH